MPVFFPLHPLYPSLFLHIAPYLLLSTKPLPVAYSCNTIHRLYVCQDGNLVDLNQYIHIATGVNTSQPPKRSDTGYAYLQQGDIYYWADQNILAICDNPTTGEWT